MSIALDFAFARPTINQIKATGATGVIRYISHSASKNITKSELGTYLAAGLPVALVFEDGATRAQQGYGAGASDAGYVLQALTALGLARDTPVFYAVDADTSWSAVKPYFDGARSLHPQASIYGGYNVVLGAWTDHIPYLWQTRAWSNGRILEAACLYQAGTTLGGSADINQIRNHDWGQIPRPEAPVTPQDITAIIQGVIKGLTDPTTLQKLRDNDAYGDLWWLDHALTGTIPQGASKAQADIITRVHADLKNIGGKP